MDYVSLGRTGLRVSGVCLGMMSYGRSEERPWALDEQAAEPIVRRAAESGVIFFYTADVYNEGEKDVITGRLLKQLFGTREEYVVATGPRQDDARSEWCGPVAARPRLDRRLATAPRPRLR
jgi:aryl-alcohol dehydrogenase-like predicted oxidoreductase